MVYCSQVLKVWSKQYSLIHNCFAAPTFLGSIPTIAKLAVYRVVIVRAPALDPLTLHFMSSILDIIT